MATIVLTGSAGHLGRHLDAELRRRGHHVRGLDLRGAGTDRGDIRSRVAVAHACAGAAGIVHLAAVSRVDDAERDPALCHDINVRGTGVLVEAALDCSRPPWMLFVSSREVLGHVPVQRPATETSQPAPLNAYARSKLQAEQLVRAARQQGLRAGTVRLSNVFGSALDRPERVIPTFVRQALTGGPLQVRGPARAFDFLHVDDAVRGLADAADHLEALRDLPEIVHLVAGKSYTLGEVAAQVVAACGSRSRLVATGTTLHEVGSFHGTHRLATAVLGWTPQVSFEQGLYRLIGHHRLSQRPEAYP